MWRSSSSPAVCRVGSTANRCQGGPWWSMAAWSCSARADCALEGVGTDPGRSDAGGDSGRPVAAHAAAHPAGGAEVGSGADRPPASRVTHPPAERHRHPCRAVHDRRHRRGGRAAAFADVPRVRCGRPARGDRDVVRGHRRRRPRRPPLAGHPRPRRGRLRHCRAARARGPLAPPPCHDAGRRRGDRRGDHAARRCVVAAAGPRRRVPGRCRLGTSRVVRVRDAGSRAGAGAGGRRLGGRTLRRRPRPRRPRHGRGRRPRRARRRGCRPFRRRAGGDVGRAGRRAPRRDRRRPGSGWDWFRWLPHAAGPDGPDVVGADDADAVVATLAAADDGTGRHVLVVTDRADLLALRTGALRRFLGAAGSAAVVAVVAPGGTAPAMCRSVLELGSIGVGRWWADATVDAHPVTVHAAGITPAAAAAAARSPRRARRPGGRRRHQWSRCPAIGIGGLNERYGTGPIDDAIAVAAAWRSAGPDPAPVAILGAAADGVVEVDLVRDGPHALVAGTTGSGKSELLRTLVVSLAARCSPDRRRVRARRLQGRFDVRRLRRPAPHRRRRHRPRRPPGRAGAGQPRCRAAPPRAAAAIGRRRRPRRAGGRRPAPNRCPGWWW